MLATLGLAALAGTAAATSYPISKDWSGSTFFNDWVYNNTYDSLTNGDAIYTNYSYASTHGMATINGSQAIVSVDYEQNVIYNYKRNTMKMSSLNQYGVGSVFVMDATHVPYGCSVWPSFWTQGANWPQDGEMDIMEAVNLQTANSYALHTSNTTSCTATSSVTQTGTLQGSETMCSTTTAAGGADGCVVQDASTDSWGAGFASSGGGVYAAELAADYIYMWYFPRANIPTDLSSNSSSVNPANWGTPSANFSNLGCSIEQEFGYQTLIIDITLCGDFAGNPNVYNETCQATKPGLCYIANVIGAGQPTYDDAAINYVRVYSSNVTMLTTTATSNDTTAAAVTSLASATAVRALASGTTTADTKSSASTAFMSLGAVAVASLIGLSQLYL